MAVTSLLGKQDIAFRGHDKTDSSLNLGNFLEVMKLLETFDYACASLNLSTLRDLMQSITDSIEQVLQVKWP